MNKKQIAVLLVMIAWVLFAAMKSFSVYQGQIRADTVAGSLETLGAARFYLRFLTDALPVLVLGGFFIWALRRK